MGLFSRDTDRLLMDSTYDARDARQAAAEGMPVTAAELQADSDAKFEKWLDATEKEWRSRPLG